jgi:hypothetical protein
MSRFPSPDRLLQRGPNGVRATTLVFRCATANACHDRHPTSAARSGHQLVAQVDFAEWTDDPTNPNVHES